jgi:hypothetical protein
MRRNRHLIEWLCKVRVQGNTTLRKHQLQTFKMRDINQKGLDYMFKWGLRNVIIDSERSLSDTKDWDLDLLKIV